MYCPHCGSAAQEDTARFCRSCGATLGATSGATAQSQSQSTAYRPSTSTQSATVEAPAYGPGGSFGGGVLRANTDPGGFLSTRPLQYAGFWRRFGAAFVDSILIWIVSFLVGFVIGFVFEIAAPRTGIGTGLAFLAGLVIGILYYPLLESSSAQATWGKRALGIMVTDLDGGRISFWRALGRNLGKFISALLLGFGYLMAAFTQRKQALHDLMASTLVVVGNSHDGFSNNRG